MKIICNVIPPNKGEQTRKTIAKRKPKVSDELRIEKDENGKITFYSALVDDADREQNRKEYFILKHDEAAALIKALAEIIM